MPPAGPAALPRVVLVDDDPAIRRLVALALEDEPLQLVSCASVAEARAALREGPVALLLTDLMLPGETGHDLLRQFADAPASARPARVVVFSAGLDDSTRQRLPGSGIWRLLPKPASVTDLLATVREGLDPAPPAAGPAAAAAAAAAPAAGDTRALAIDRHFGGNAALHDAFRQGCLGQWAQDLAQGDRAVAAGDVAALRHLGHSLKSVLRLLAEDAAADAALALDRAAAQADAPGLPDAVTAAWQRLRQALVGLLQGP